MSAKAGSTWPTSISVWPLRSRARQSASAVRKGGQGIRGHLPGICRGFRRLGSPLRQRGDLQEEGRNKEARDYFEEVQAADASDVPDAGAGEKQPAVPRVPRKSQPDWRTTSFPPSSGNTSRCSTPWIATATRDTTRNSRIAQDARAEPREMPGIPGPYAGLRAQLIQAIGTAKDAAKQRAYKQQALD